MEEEKLYHTLILFKFVFQSEIHSSNIPFQKKKKEEKSKKPRNEQNKIYKQRFDKNRTERFHRTAIFLETSSFFFFVLVSIDPSPANNFELFDRKSSRDSRGISLSSPSYSAQLGGKESVDHARRAASLISGEIKPRRSKLALHNGVEGGGRRPNFQFRGQKESSTLKIEIDQSCAATVCFFFPLLPLFPFVFRFPSRSSFSRCFFLFFFPFDSLIPLYRRTLVPRTLPWIFRSTR